MYKTVPFDRKPEISNEGAAVIFYQIAFLNPSYKLHILFQLCAHRFPAR